MRNTKSMDAPPHEKGWPHLRVLTDDAVSPAKAVAEAVKGLQAIDPYFAVAIPREIARRYVRGYLYKPYEPKIKQQVADETEAVDAELLAEVLEKKWGPSKTCEYGSETYDYRLEEMILLFEAFLGTETVAKILVELMVAARDNPTWWGTSTFLDHHHQGAARIARIVGWLRLRLPPATWKKLVAPLKGSKQAKLPKYCAALNELADDAVPTENIDLMLQRRDAKAAKKYFVDHPKGWHVDPQLYFVIGADQLSNLDVSRIKGLAKWQQLRIIDELGTLPGPGTVRLIQALATSRSAGAAAAAWLEAHGVKAAPPPAPVNKKEIDKQLKAIFRGIEKLLVAQKGDPKKERKVMDQAYAQYTELRAARGDVIPEAYFTHSFADVTPKWKADEQTSKRWIDLAVAAATD